MARNARLLAAVFIALLGAAAAAAGGFASGRALPVEKPLVEHWNGSAWTETGPPRPRGSVLYAAKAFSSSDVWAVGSSDKKTAKGLRYPAFTEHYNGTSWSPAALPLTGYGDDLLAIDGSSRTDIWAVGEHYRDKTTPSRPLVEHFNGTAWKVVPSVALRDADLRGVAAISPRNVWAVGGDARKAAPTLIEHWDGHAWRRVKTPDPKHPGSLSAVSAVSARNIWAAGSYGYHGRTLPLLLHWNGHRWKRFAGATLTQDAYLWGVTTIGRNDAWAVGETRGHSFAEHWNGRRWNVVSVPEPDGSRGLPLYSVSAVSANDVWADGPAWVDGTPVTAAVHWDGHAWNIVPTVDRPNTPNVIDAVAAIPSGDVWVVGWSGSP